MRVKTVLDVASCFNVDRAVSFKRPAAAACAGEYKNAVETQGRRLDQ